MEPEKPSQVVLVTPQGEPRGTLLKKDAHTPHTPLHLGFSCHVVDGGGNVLVTRRALSKKTWPGVWTNSFCGHPGPDEPWEDAVRRHGRLELGLDIADVSAALPDFRYRATDASGIVENEICPVFTVTVDHLPQPNPEEVMETAWVAPQQLRDAVEAAPWAFSPWMVMQIPQMPLYGERSQPRAEDEVL
ncbi:isopentenyl-diphosphate Delta-isomerase [Nesterenkonia populi]|uniref:isopentenyl-diphosphate Delta-isomerase n=1 Tax=Nesterenkonia populi TaxID=1591087 RepID=UPI0011BD8619|nr:isopentenyl-diphosphate Delta-isomerase [Nesterenkonia populi]